MFYLGTSIPEKIETFNKKTILTSIYCGESNSAAISKEEKLFLWGAGR